MSKENRKSTRYPFRASSVTNIKGNGLLNEVSTIANNLSHSGIGLRAYMPLMTGSCVSVDLSFINKRGAIENDTVNGRVAWSSRKGELFFAGITFNEELHPDKHPHLYRHFNEFVKSELSIA
ncbi:MAG: PilZ domain-containing protein [Thermodesulfovibrionales bacterium]